MPVSIPDSDDFSQSVPQTNPDGISNVGGNSSPIPKGGLVAGSPANCLSPPDSGAVTVEPTDALGSGWQQVLVMAR